MKVSCSEKVEAVTQVLSYFACKTLSILGSADLMPLITVTIRLVLNLDTPRHFTFFIVYLSGFTYKIEFLKFSVS